MLRLRDLSIFRRLMFAMVATALLVALVSGGAHYLFAVGLIKTSVRSQIDSALAGAAAYLDRAYAVQVAGDLRLLASSPVVDDLLMSMGAERYLDRPAAEGMFLSLVRVNPALYSSLSLLDANGDARVSVMHGRRMRPELLQLPAEPMALFKRLAAEPPGTLLYHGPLFHADGRHSMLVGITKRDPDLGTFGGAIIAEVPLDDFIAHLASRRALNHPIAWLLAADGRVMLAPPAQASRLDPRAYLDGAPAPDGAIVQASALAGPDSPLALFRVAFSLPADVSSASLSRAGGITSAVLVLVVLASCALAWLLARQIASPMRALSELADAVGAGDLSQRMEQRWGGEEGRLARAFNRMLDALNMTTVSRAYVNSIIESMGDAVIVVDPAGVIESVNHAAGVLLGCDSQQLPGTRLDQRFSDAKVRAHLDSALAAHAAFELEQTRITRGDHEQVPVWLSCAPMGSADGAYCGMVAVVRDISESLRAQRELEAAHQALSFHVENSPLAVIEWDAELRVRRWSRRAEEVFGWRAEEVVGRDPNEWPFIIEADRELARTAGQRLVAGEPRNMCRYRNYRKDGTVVHCEWHNSLLVDRNGEPLSVLSLVQDVTESVTLAEELSHQASHDALTGLYNRRAFDHRLEAVVSAVRDSDAEHVLCFIDLDQFKAVNDSCGHGAGDELLRQVGARLMRAVRRGDTVARLGGDEFAVLLENCSMSAASRLAGELLRALREHPFVWNAKSFRLNASIGLVGINRDLDDAAAVMSAADTACMIAKNEGRDRVHVFDDHEDLDRRRGEAQWVPRINAALDEDRFFLMAQPIAPLAGDDGVEGFELLLRMSDEHGQVISPGAFLPAAERYHIMPKIDRWVIRSAIDLIAATPAARAARLRCFVNLSGQTLADGSLRDFIAEQLERTGVAPQTLCFEITETAAVADFTRANTFIESLTALGCRFALDDFGSGVSSFAYLKNLPVHYLKIDGMFVRDIASDVTSRALVRSINEVGHAMGKRTVAECVENDAILACLRDVGVDYVQGFHIGRPVLASDALASTLPKRVAAG